MKAALAAGAQALLDAGNIDLPRPDFLAISQIMQEEARIHLPETKHTLVQSRLVKRLRANGLASFADYVALVRRDQAERFIMVEALTTNHTHFFRENHHFEHLMAEVIPALRAKVASGQPVRIWSAGSSSGEEVYTIAMCLAGKDRAAARWLFDGKVRLLATDIAPAMVDQVRRGVYPAASVEPVPAAYRQLWMEKDGDQYRMTAEMRQLVQANVLNLFGPWPMRHRYDVIFCRNVMIYFDDAAKAELEARFVELLLPGGHLYIGHSERLMGAATQGMTRAGQTVFRKAGGQP